MSVFQKSACVGAWEQPAQCGWRVRPYTHRATLPTADRATLPRVITWKKEGSSIPIPLALGRYLVKCINSNNEGNENGFKLKSANKVELATYV